jgi:hypothetical protein
MNNTLKTIQSSPPPTCILWQGRIRTATPGKIQDA